jgi:hypothetical protein
MSKKPLSAEDCLLRIEPAVPKRRFLQWWDAAMKELWFGLGTGENAIAVCSKRKLERQEQHESLPISKLTREAVQEFRSQSKPIAGPELFRQCRSLLSDYVHLGDERVYDLISVWMIGTYLYALFGYYGYLFFHSKLLRSGKTRLLEVLSHLCFNATVPLNGPTVPTIREAATDGGAVLLDTLERWREKSSESYAAAMEFLDAGFRNGGTTTKMVQDKSKQWRKGLFPIYTPYVLAGINKNSLTDTALDRSFVIEMQRKTIAVKKRKYEFNSFELECQPLRRELYRWALENANAVHRIYESTELEAEVDALELNDRAADIWRPMLAVAIALGVPELSQSLKSLATDMSRDPEAEHVRAVVKGLRSLVKNGVAVGMTSEFTRRLQDRGLTISDLELHRLLTAWGFTQHPERLEQGPRRAWHLEDSRLAELEHPLSPCEKVTTLTTPQVVHSTDYVFAVPTI